MLVHDADRHLAIIERYHAKVNHPAYGDFRKRGNPPAVIAAVAILRGNTACVRCGFVGYTQLHHVDGIWKNYALDNLQFYCKSCHYQSHKEMNMAGKGTYNWTQELLNDLRGDVNHFITSGAGMTKTAAYAKVAAKWKIAPTYVAKLCMYDLDEMSEIRKRNYENRKERASGQSTTEQTVLPRQTRTSPNNAKMTLAEAREFYNFCRQSGITIS